MGIEHHGEVDHRPIHYSDRFPVERTACGKDEPATNVWQYVTCPACIELRVAYRELGPER
jgi:hypothetical protein